MPLKQHPIAWQSERPIKQSSCLRDQESFAVRWILDRGDTMTALWGARSARQLDAVSEAFGWKLDSEDYKQVDKILAETIKAPVRREFMAPPARQVRQARPEQALSASKG